MIIKGGFETMNKNLKKVISAVAALAMSVTSFVAMASYPDVADTDKHASAINELSALGVIEGFEDGTFHPDELVTRAQMAAMVCRALNNFNAESNKIQKFNDVPADNWAAGWVATAADAGIINGTGNGNFDPSLNVTYAQTAKMLVSAMGYGDWAENAGGWPSGYLSYANSTGVTSNVTGVANDTALTRAQCAQMIANALEAPMLKQTSMQTGYDGKPYAVLTQMDGTNDDKSPYTSLLVDKWDMYVVNGTVEETSKSGDLSNDEVRYKVTQSKNYMGYSYGSSLKPKFEGTNDGFTVKTGKTDADKYLNVYTKAVIKNDDYNDPELMYIEGSTKNTEVKVSTNLIKFDDVSDTFTQSKDYDVLKVKKSGSSNSTTSYKLDKNWKLIVNGKEQVASTTTPIVDLLKKYIDGSKNGNPGATVTLTDYPTNNVSTDGYYDVISVDYKITAVVDSITDDDDETTIYFKDASQSYTELVVKKDDEDYSYKFTKDGVAVNPAELKEYDVLSIVANVEDFENSKFYDVTVSDKTIEGKVTQSGTDNDTDEAFYTVNNENLVVAGGMTVKPKTGDEYTLYMTADGKIAAMDKLASSINYAVLDRAYEANSGEKMVRIIAKDGKKYEYELSDATNADPDGIIAKLITAQKKDWSDRLADVPMADRIVDYSLTSGNKIKIKAKGDISINNYADAEYKASTKRIGGKKVDDSTVVLDLSDWYKNGSDAAALVSASSFVDGSKYGVTVAYDKSTSSASDAVPFVAVYDGFSGWSSDTQMAIVSKKMSTSEDGQNRTALEVYINGELTQVTCEDDSSKYNFEEGDAILFSKNSDGYVDEVYNVLDSSVVKVSSDKYALFKAIKAGTAINSDVKALKLHGSDGDVQFIIAPVISKTTSSVEIAAQQPSGSDLYESTIAVDATKGDKDKLTTGKDAWYVDVDKTDSISYAENVKVYTYKGENSKGYRVDKSAAAGVVASAVANASEKSTSYLDVNGQYINLGLDDGKKSVNKITFALMRVYDDQIQEIYSIQTSVANGQEAGFAK